MNDFFGRLAAQVVSPTATIEPRRASRHEPDDSAVRTPTDPGAWVEEVPVMAGRAAPDAALSDSGPPRQAQLTHEAAVPPPLTRAEPPAQQIDQRLGIATQASPAFEPMVPLVAVRTPFQIGPPDVPEPLDIDRGPTPIVTPSEGGPLPVEPARIRSRPIDVARAVDASLMPAAPVSPSTPAPDVAPRDHAERVAVIREPAPDEVVKSRPPAADDRAVPARPDPRLADADAPPAADPRPVARLVAPAHVPTFEPVRPVDPTEVAPPAAPLSQLASDGPTRARAAPVAPISVDVAVGDRAERPVPSPEVIVEPRAPAVVAIAPHPPDDGPDTVRRRDIDETSEPPIVRVTIGRIEVRAPAPLPAAGAQTLGPPPRPAPVDRRLSLDDYLERRRAALR